MGKYRSDAEFPLRSRPGDLLMTGRILIAGRESSDKESLRQILEAEGWRIVEAHTAEKILAFAHTTAVDVFLIEIDLPETNTPELCRAIHNVERHRNTPIVFLVREADAAHFQQMLTTGGDDFISAPYLPIAVNTRLKINLDRADHLQHLDNTRRTLKKYFSKRTLDIIENSLSTGTLPPPEEQELAICFTDMRGFTAFSEETEPNRLFALVSSLLADQVQIIHKYSGYVDKFGGDGVMAIFEGPDMLMQSCLCALSILESARVSDALVAQQMPRFGIGIHTGRAVVGNIGSPEHLDYSAVGSTVNLAARLCGEAQATSIAVSKAVRDAVHGDPRLHFHSERQVPIKGIRGPVTVYTLSRP
jgi:adenylate cyclase